MATRRNLAHSAEVREKIQTSQLINRLTDHVFGRQDMSKTQVSAAIALLRKTLPDLQSVEMKSDVTVRNVARLPEPAKSAQEWSTRHSPPSPTLIN